MKVEPNTYELCVLQPDQIAIMQKLEMVYAEDMRESEELMLNMMTKYPAAYQVLWYEQQPVGAFSVLPLPIARYYELLLGYRHENLLQEVPIGWIDAQTCLYIPTIVTASDHPLAHQHGLELIRRLKQHVRQLFSEYPIHGIGALAVTEAGHTLCEMTGMRHYVRWERGERSSRYCSSFHGFPDDVRRFFRLPTTRESI